MDELDPIFIAIVTNLVLSAMALFAYCLIAQPPDDSMTPLIVMMGTFVGLAVVEFLGWLFHIPEWLRWFREKTDPEQGDKHGSR